MSLRLVQFIDRHGARCTGVPSEDGRTLAVLTGAGRVYDLALGALAEGVSLEAAVRARLGRETVDYDAVVAEGRLLPPIDHPDLSRCHVTGTGLTHLGSADTRDKMHRSTIEAEEEKLTDSMRMFRWGLEKGRPPMGEVGVQPEWFYKGNGRFVVAPEKPLVSPAFAEDGGEEPELAGLYVIASDGTPVRLGFAIANEFSDHVMERRNYLFLAHSKLRQSSFGPELRLGPPPADIRGTSRIRRQGAVIWEKPFLTGEANMSHSLANLEHHHFKYAEHRVPGDVHVHYFGTATLSFADGVRPEPGDVFEIEAAGFGRPLRNPLAVEPGGEVLVRVRDL
ncbi:GguC family protein [Chelatococcus sp. SYSU_G07232]|uniref:GguC family protein n=1 Tax=Chelatococcus albus TaxID=3047466 RepID=A0ABT7AH11_9HYPH|nr:AraD1 family protein [Chelatococcus sp. SYSU_G07232]MDJ1158657.1 GguC family protein [Chelatococcus sp. SYSU_G07232]